MQLQPFQALGDADAGAGQERHPDPVGPFAEPEVEARGLDLSFGQGPSRRDETLFAESVERPCGQDSPGHLDCGRLALRLRHAAIEAVSRD